MFIIKHTTITLNMYIHIYYYSQITTLAELAYLAFLFKQLPQVFCLLLHLGYVSFSRNLFET